MLVNGRIRIRTNKYEFGCRSSRPKNIRILQTHIQIDKTGNIRIQNQKVNSESTTKRRTKLWVMNDLNTSLGGKCTLEIKINLYYQKHLSNLVEEGRTHLIYLKGTFVNSEHTYNSSGTYIVSLSCVGTVPCQLPAGKPLP